MQGLEKEEKQAAHNHGRLVSIDALRGFDMFWIIGGSRLFKTFILLFIGTLPPWLKYQLSHPQWIGFSAWDVIMPLFMFVSGLSMPFSFGKRLARGDKKSQIYLKVVIRVVILFILGMVMQGNLLEFDLSSLIVYSNTLQSIAIGYLISSILFLELRLKWQLIVTAGLLTGYWALMTFVSFNGHPAGTMEPGTNLAAYTDQVLFGRFADRTTYTWGLSSINFGVMVMLGVFAGQILMMKRSNKDKCLWLLAASLNCLLLGLLWTYLGCPFNKHIYSSSMVLWAGGWSGLLLLLFYWIIDLKGYKKWAFPFVVIGMNSIFIYVGHKFIGFNTIANKLCGGLAEHMNSDWKRFVLSLTSFALAWLLLYYMYRKKTFVRV